MSQHNTLMNLVKAVDAEMSESWECASYHPSLRPALEAARAALSATQPAQAAQSGNRPTPEWYARKIQETLDDDFAIGPAAVDEAQAAQPVPRDVIRDVFLRNGFTIKDGCSDLKPYVYAAANALLEVAAAQPAPVVPEGWEIREEATWVYFKRPDGFYQAVTPNDSHQSHAQTLHMLMRAMLAATPTPPAQAAADARDAERWRMAVLIQSETLTPPDHRKNQQALNAYIKALGGGIDFQGAIDAALATHQQRQGGAAIAASGRQS